MHFSISYLTSRSDPRFSWFCDSLARQMKPEDSVDIIVIDYRSWYEDRNEYFISKARERQNIVVSPPKPCAWQGPYKRTKVDHFAAANARNTALILANSEYIVFADDLSVLMPGWLDNVRHAAENRYVVAGAYAKVNKLVVEDGEVKSHEPYDGGKDCRTSQGSHGGIKKVDGSFLFGCSFGVPLKKALEIGGMDEACNGMGFEDVCFGHRIAHELPVFYNLNMLTWESEELHFSEGNAHFHRQHYDVPGFTPPPGGKPHSDWYMLVYARNNTNAYSPGEKLTLVEQREYYQKHGKFAESTVDTNWADNRPLEDL